MTRTGKTSNSESDNFEPSVDSSEDEAMSEPELILISVQPNKVNNANNVWNEITQDPPQFIFEETVENVGFYRC